MAVKFPSHKLQTGIQITLNSRNERDSGMVKVVLSRQDQGADPISCNKTGDKVVKSLEQKIFAGNISLILMSIDADEYDVAANTISWSSRANVNFAHNMT